MTGKTEQESLTEISSKLDSLIRLTALNLVNGIKLQKDKILDPRRGGIRTRTNS